MRKFLFLPLLALLASCGKDEDYDRSNPKPEEMVTPALYATIQQNTTDLYNGPLEVLPCRPDGSIYVGNCCIILYIFLLIHLIYSFCLLYNLF